MQHCKRIYLLGLLLILLAVWLARPAAAWAASPAHSPRCGGWSIVTSPNPDSQYDEFLAVAAVSESSVWAVGFGDSPSSGLHTLIEHYDGASWQVAPSPSAGGSILFGVAAISATDVWTVGYGQDAQQPLIEHWDGTQWSIVAAPAPSANYIGLQAVSADSASDVWAVGVYTQGSLQKTLIEHYNGMSWSLMKSPNPGTAYNDLRGVTAISPSDVWAVGESGNRQPGPLSEHWDGTRWQVVPVPSHTTPTALFGVTALSSTDVWAVGQAGGVGYASWHWNGTHWRHVSVPQSRYGQALAVSASSPDNIWSVGVTQGGSAITQAAHWDGKQWKPVPPRNRPRTDNVLYGVVMPSAQTVWAVGYYGHYGYWTKTLIEYYC